MVLLLIAVWTSDQLEKVKMTRNAKMDGLHS